jgi:hypothetical protein
MGSSGNVQTDEELKFKFSSSLPTEKKLWVGQDLIIEMRESDSQNGS